MLTGNPASGRMERRKKLQFIQGRFMGIIQAIARRAARTDYARRAIAGGADLSRFREPLTARIVIGLVVIALSYLLGWPAVAFFGFMALWLREPLVAVIGGPLIYGFSHILFWVGFYIAGAEHTKALFMWATRRALEKILNGGKPFPANSSNESNALRSAQHPVENDTVDKSTHHP